MKILNCVYKLLYGIFLIGAILVTFKNVFCVYRIGYFQLFDFLPVYGASDPIPHEKTQTQFPIQGT